MPSIFTQVPARRSNPLRALAVTGGLEGELTFVMTWSPRLFLSLAQSHVLHWSARLGSQGLETLVPPPSG